MQNSIPIADSARRAHEDQNRRVAASVMGDAGQGIHHRRRFISGVAAAAMRDSIRIAVTTALGDQGMTHLDVANAGALAADRALASVGYTIGKGNGREDLSGSLAHIELLIRRADSAFFPAPGSSWKTRGTDALAEALAEVQSLIDSVHKEQ